MKHEIEMILSRVFDVVDTLSLGLSTNAVGPMQTFARSYISEVIIIAVGGRLYASIRTESALLKEARFPTSSITGSMQAGLSVRRLKFHQKQSKVIGYQS
ncbi:MAG: hypothetical protein CL607_20315 [Anaerolineaceae bacterium]|nr:hypothetical protein [Anaerolineaceae bacterium]